MYTLSYIKKKNCLALTKIQQSDTRARKKKPLKNSMKMIQNNLRLIYTNK